MEVIKLKDGVWRTIAGRKVFIKTGQSLSDAMKESGKFEKTNKLFDDDTSRQLQKREQLEKEIDNLRDELDEYGRAFDNKEAQREKEARNQYYKQHPELNEKDKYREWIQSEEYKNLDKKYHFQDENYKKMLDNIKSKQIEIDNIDKSIKSKEMKLYKSQINKNIIQNNAGRTAIATDLSVVGSEVYGKYNDKIKSITIDKSDISISNYLTFELQNEEMVTVRISDHKRPSYSSGGGMYDWNYDVEHITHDIKSINWTL